MAASFTARLVAELQNVPLPDGTLLNINVPGASPTGVSVARLGKRVYRDELALVEEDPATPRDGACTGSMATRRYLRDETGTDLAAVAAGEIAVTPDPLRSHRPRRAGRAGAL